MSIKSILVLICFSMILSGQNTMAQAAPAFSGAIEEHDIESAQSMKSMKPLLDLNQGMVPFSEFEPKSSIKNFTLMTQEALDNQKIVGMSTSSLLSSELQDEIINYQFAKRVNFAVTETTGAEVARNSLKKESWLETMEKYLEKLAPYLNNYGQYEMLY